MKTKHTPGPWIYDHNPKPMHDNIVIGKPTKDSEGGNDIWEVCAVRSVKHFGGNIHPTALADAKLISAAPELLEACKSMLAWMQNCALDTFTTTPNAVIECQAARLAIEKAES